MAVESIDFAEELLRRVGAAAIFLSICTVGIGMKKIKGDFIYE